MDYGTGAIFGCPAHDQRDFEFATQIRPADHAASSPPSPEEADKPIGDEADSGDGVLVNSPLPRRHGRRGRPRRR